MPMISIVIPAFNEERYLPRTLKYLQRQTYLEFEIIVADGDSIDSTRRVAENHGVILVAGGRPAEGRNAGARRAKGEYLLFLDADVRVEPTFLTQLMEKITQNHLDVASGFIIPESNRLADQMMVLFSNLYHYLLQRISPHASGFYIVAKKSLHDKIGGFNERLFLTEDHEYVARAAHYGKFRYLWYPQVHFSVRRFNQEGRINLIWKFFVLEMYRLLKEVRREIITYEFGKF
jgi:glycosyltransferase involved in cell wall biosynthesis